MRGITMEEKDIEKILDELNQVRPEVLNPEAKRLFDAIMQIADERDMYKRQVAIKDGYNKMRR